jgi:hypothetical protein
MMTKPLAFANESRLATMPKFEPGGAIDGAWIIMEGPWERFDFCTGAGFSDWCFTAF